LNENEQHFIKHILAFFASSDGIVFENISVNFSKEIANYQRLVHSMRIKNTMRWFMVRHIVCSSKSTSKTIVEKDKIFRAIETISCVANKRLIGL
jgi:ribonucleoside-diphosphate reductase beta chain